MPTLFLPFQLVLLMFAGWINRHQLDVIEYLHDENRVLKARLGRTHLVLPTPHRERFTSRVLPHILTTTG